MALPLPRGLTPAEVAFICEMELVTVIPRQRLDAIELLGGRIPALEPPRRSDVPLWLALLLKRQRRAKIIQPPWLYKEALAAILEFETEHARDTFSPPPRLPPQTVGTGAVEPSPPFVPSSTYESAADALPYHWLELGEMLLEAAADDMEEPEQVRRLMRDLREVRLSKLRAGVDVLDAGGGVKMNGVGAMEVAEGRAFIGGVIDGLRKINASREQTRREDEAAGQADGLGRAAGFDDNDDDDDEMND